MSAVDESEESDEQMMGAMQKSFAEISKSQKDTRKRLNKKLKSYDIPFSSEKHLEHLWERVTAGQYYPQTREELDQWYRRVHPTHCIVSLRYEDDHSVCDLEWKQKISLVELEVLNRHNPCIEFRGERERKWERLLQEVIRDYDEVQEFGDTWETPLDTLLDKVDPSRWDSDDDSSDSDSDSDEDEKVCTPTKRAREEDTGDGDDGTPSKRHKADHEEDGDCSQCPDRGGEY